MNVRFTSDVLAQVNQAAEKFGLTKSAIIKLATALFVDDFERSGNASLPRNWQEILSNLDGRSQRYAAGGVGHRKKMLAPKKVVAKKSPRRKKEL